MSSDTEMAHEATIAGQSTMADGAEPACAIEAHHLSKTYHIYKASSDRLKQILWGGKRKYYNEFVALTDISFQLGRGEVLGLVGRNGAGKSTLLQLICGTVTATGGSLAVNGRIAALLELGAGFNPQFTGRENIYLAAMVMGVSRQEVDERLEGIIDFSGIRPFIDQPVLTYSSGMYVRLAFSVATSVDPDILIIDEALSVGDGDFARRSFDRIMAMRDAGVTILFCSHSLYQIEVLCTRAIWLEKGKVKASGTPDEVIPAYQSFLDRLANNVPDPSSVVKQHEDIANSMAPEAIAEELEGLEDKDETQDVANKSTAHVDSEVALAAGPRITKIRASSGGVEGKTLSLVSGEGDLTLSVEYQIPQSDNSGETPQVALVIVSAGGQLVTSTGSWAQHVNPEVDSQGVGRVMVRYDTLGLLKGEYHVSVLLFCERGLFLHEEINPAVTLHVTQRGQERGLVYLPHHWYTPANAPVRWRAVDSSEVSLSALLALFAEVFGYQQSADIWRWKYRFATTYGSVVVEGDRPVAFNGAIPRNGWVFGQPESLVQMGDVMASPHVRGVLTRKGPFFMAVAHYLTQHVGPQSKYPLAFGFPNERHFKIGVRRGLYGEVDRILEMNWPALEPSAQALGGISITRIGKAEYALYRSRIDALWLRMREQMAAVAVGCRDSKWLEHRYFDKPNSSYRLCIVATPSGDDLGLFVLGQPNEERTELLDVVGPAASIERLVLAARRVASTAIFAWATPRAIDWFLSTEPVVTPTEVVIPGNTLTDENCQRVKDCWWLMGGDTDFR